MFLPKNRKALGDDITNELFEEDKRGTEHEMHIKNQQKENR